MDKSFEAFNLINLLIMKKIYILIIVLLVSVSGFGKDPSEYAVIRGKLTMEKLPSEITLFKVVNGEGVAHSKVAVEKDGTFGFCLVPQKPGIYRIGERNVQARLYLTPGKQTDVSISAEGFTITGSSDKENVKMAEWENIISRVKRANMLIGNFTFNDIFPIIPEVEKQKDAFIAGLKTGNKEFDGFMKGMAQAEFEYELYHFLYMPRTVHPEFKDHPEVYGRLSSKEHFTTTETLNYDFGLVAVNSYIQYLMAVRLNKEGIKYSPEQNEKVCIENVKNDTLKGWYFLNSQLLRSKAYDQVHRDKVEKYKKYLLVPEQLEKLHAFELTIRKMGDGEAALNFTGTTVDGKKVSLSDFKGKVVVVDVWATWCGPCKKEIPALKQLEEEMHGKDVVFISYSVDKQKDHDKWLKFVADEKLGGVQLFGPADFASPICVDYKINAIPRFMVFDKKGNIVSTDSPRPSSPELKTLLEKYLK